MNEHRPINKARRDLLLSALAASVTPTALTARSSAKAPEDRDPALIRRENQRPGTQDWQLTRVKPGRSPYRSPFIEGYCSRQSVEAGDELEIKVSLNPPGEYMIEIFRMGYYGGAGARRMTVIGPLKGDTQPDPEIGPKRLRECRWKTSTTLTLPADWPSGVYLGRLTRLPAGAPNAWQSYVVFIVRDNRPADILFQCSDNTWAAYNRWPDDYSLYTDPRGSLSGGVEVSFDRPYGKYSQIFTECPQSVGSGEFLLWEYPLCHWLEQHGYDVTYCSNSDLLTPDRALRCKAFVSVGHDEYWDLRQYQSLKHAIDAGVSALFLSGNSVCFVAPFRVSTDGRPNRVITRAGRYGGLSEPERKIMGPFETEGPNENLLIGARTINPFNGGGDWICTRPEHWLFAGTGMRMGDRIPGLVGWEFHGEPADLPGLEVIAEGTALNSGNKEAHWTATIYPGPKGNVVYNASTIWWAQGLSSPPGHALPWSHYTRPHGPDARVQRITQNVLARCLNGEA